MASPGALPPIRRSVVLPASLVDRAKSIAPPELQNNFNRLVQRALEEYVRTREAQALDETLALMARDPAIRYASKTIASALKDTEADGLGDEE